MLADGDQYTAAPRTFEGATFQFTATFNARVAPKSAS
jgi:hypothetical protein